ncbi:hypothetical protein SISNIDRAFT_399410, partial [Sistotremastrum niveocremeum HHB9708]
MPVQRTKGAPKFDGKPGNILDFLDEFETHARKARLPQQQMIQIVGKYADKPSRELWEQLPGFTEEPWDWAAYRASILDLYPQSDQSKKFAISDLLKLVHKYHKKPMKELSHFSKYDRKFKRISLWLRSRNRIA